MSFSASRKYGVVFAISCPTWPTYSSQLFLISSVNSRRTVPSASALSRRSGKYVTMSEISARASRRALLAGSDEPNGDGAREGAGAEAAAGAGRGAGVDAAAGALTADGAAAGTGAGVLTAAGAG